MVKNGQNEQKRVAALQLQLKQEHADLGKLQLVNYHNAKMN